MDTILHQINKIPGIVGSLICHESGTIQCNALPARFDDNTLNEVGSVLADNLLGINNAVDTVGMCDLRYSDGRILVKPIHNHYLLLICEPKINLQLVNLSLDVSIKKLDKILQDHPAVKAASSASSASAAVSAGQGNELRMAGKGVVLTVDSMKASANIKWDQMKEDAAVSKVLAQQLMQLLKTDSLKKIKLNNRTAEKSKVFHLVVYDRGDGSTFDDKIALTLAASEALMAKPGDELIIELGGGFFS